MLSPLKYSLALMMCVIITHTLGAWSLTVLHPSSATNSGATGASNGQQSGSVTTPEGQSHAGYWSSSAASFVDLTPSATYLASANATTGSQQGGQIIATAFSGHAYLWSGTAASAVDLHPAGFMSSNVLAMHGSMQGGYVNTSIGPSTEQATVWSGTAASYVNLHPSSHPAGFVSSRITAMAGSQQAGYGTVSNGSQRALLWSGSAADVIYLHAGTTTTLSRSLVYAMTASQQGGVVNIGSGGTSTETAAIWSGTAESRVDLHPSGATSSRVLAMAGSYQGGQVDDQAAVWQGTAASWVNLHSILVDQLGTNYTRSAVTGASDIGSNITLSGYAVDTVNNKTIAVMWTSSALVTAPTIIKHPQSQSANAGTDVTLIVTASGTAPLTYQWRKNGNPVGNNSASLPLTNLTAGDAANYDVVVFNSAGSVTSNAAILIVSPIATAGTRHVVAPGDDLTLSIPTSGSATYQWRHNFDPVPGATSPTLILNNITYADSGHYVLAITDNIGTSLSAPIFVLVAPSATQVLAWGEDFSIETGPYHYETSIIPLAATDVISVAVGGDHALALLRDGNVVAWGRNNVGQSTVPEGLDEVVALAAGDTFSLALKSDGTVVQWGQHFLVNQPVPTGLNTVVAIAAGQYHAVALLSNGTVASWGWNPNGNGVSDVRQITAGDGYTAALKNDGSVEVYDTNLANALNQVPPEATGAISIAGGDDSIFALKSDGTIVGWGYSPNAIPIPNHAHGVVSIDAGRASGVGLRNNGTLSIWGDPSDGVLNPPSHAVDIYTYDISTRGSVIFAVRTANATAVPTFFYGPIDTSISMGSNATLTALAGGIPAPAYQWQRYPTGGSGWSDLSNDGIYTGVTSSTLSIANTSFAMDGDLFRCVATNDYGHAISTSAAISITIPPPIITEELPSSVVVPVGGTLSFTITATSYAPMSFEWLKGSAPLPESNSASFAIPNAQFSDGGSYAVRITNSSGTITSSSTNAVVVPPPVITKHPTSETVFTGASPSLSVSANSTVALSYAPLTYKWYKNGNPISGPDTTSSTFTINSATAADAGSYSVLVTNMTGALMSESATITIDPHTLPSFSQSPVNTAILSGNTAQFHAIANGDPAPTYQWQVWRAGGGSGWANTTDGTSYSGSQTALLTVLGSTLANDRDIYRCIAYNEAGSATSQSARLSVYNAGMTKVSAGRYHSLRIATDGNLKATGLNPYGQLGDGTFNNTLSPQSVEIAGHIIADIAAGAQHTLILTTDKSLWVTGLNSSGQLGDDSFVAKSSPIHLANDVAAFAAGLTHSVYAKIDGTLWTVGGNDSGQLGNGSTSDSSVATQVATDVIDVAAGLRQTIYLKSDGSLWGMGDMNGSGIAVTAPIQIATGVKTMAAGGYHILFVKTDGTLWTTGYNPYGQLGNGTTTTTSNPAQIATDVRSVAAGYFHSLFLKTDRSLWVMGYNSSGQLGDGTTTNRPTPFRLATDVHVFSGSEAYTLFTNTYGTLWGTGYNAYGQFGNDSNTTTFSPIHISDGSIFKPSAPSGVVASTSSSYDRVLLHWAPDGNATTYEVWRSSTPDPATATRVATDLRWAAYVDNQIALGQTYHYWVKAVNSAGAGDYSSPVSIDVGSPETNPPLITSQSEMRHMHEPGHAVTLSITTTGSGPLSYQWFHNGQAISGANGPTLALTDMSIRDHGAYWASATNSAGSIRSAPMFVLVAPAVTQLVPWGGNFYGAVLPPTGVTDVIAIAAGDSHALGLKRDGTVLAWGDNAHGQSTVPAGLTGVVALAAGGNHSAALKSDGTVVTWGAYYSGSNEPIPAGLTPVTGLFTDGRGTLAVGIDGTVTGWNSSGVIANTLTDIAHAVMGGTYHLAMAPDGNLQIWGGTPIGPDKVPTDLAGYHSIDAESSNYVATKSDGTVVQWGRFYNGQANAPAGLTTVMAVAAAADHSLALQQDGTVVAWGGYNAYGQANVPAGLNQVFTIAAGGTHSLALRDAGMDTAPSIITQPTDKTVSLGGEFTLSVVAEGTLPTYEWRQGGMTLAENSRRTGVRTATLHVTNAQLADAGGYTVTVRNSQGSVTSQIATVAVDKLGQAITFPVLYDCGYTQTAVNLSATASSGLPVTFAVVSGPATITGTQLRLTGLGTVTVRATQAGDLTYAPATPVDRSFIVTGNLLWWNEEHFTSTELADAAISGPTADPDGDGLSNLLEYALDLNPKSVDTTGLPEMGASASDWTYTYTRPADRPDLTYEVETSTDLVNWTTAGVTHSMTAELGAEQIWQATVPHNAASNVFFRLKVTQ